MCNECVKEESPDRGRICLEIGSYLLNFRACANCEHKGELVIVDREVIQEGDTEVIVYDHQCGECGHVVAKHHYTFNVMEEYQEYEMECVLCGIAEDSISITPIDPRTDEHGTKVQKAAVKAGLPLNQFSDIAYGKFLKMFQLFDIGYTELVRTSNSCHHNAVAHFWMTLMSSGLIRKGTYTGWYSEIDECFVPESQIDHKKDLAGNIQTVSKEYGNPVVWCEEENYIFNLSHFHEPLKKWLSTVEIYPQQFHDQVADMLEGPLGDLSISRPTERLMWAIPVPGDPSQTIYVWLDALVNYLTASGYPEPLGWWPPIHIIGKDILKFHAIYWPAFLLAAGIQPPKTIICHSHWLVDDRKMSKSYGNVVKPGELLDKFTSDGWRYFLLREGVLSSDSNYNAEKLARMLNAELADNLGNLLRRCTSHLINPAQIFPYFDVKNVKGIGEIGESLIQRTLELPEAVISHYQSFHFYKGLDCIQTVLRHCNQFFQASRPWDLAKENQDLHLYQVLYITMEVLRVCGILLIPVVPNIALALLRKLGGQGKYSISQVQPFFREPSHQKAVDISMGELIAKGSHVVLQREDYFQVYKISDRLISLGREKVQLNCVVGHPYGTTFKLVRPEGDTKCFMLEPTSSAEFSFSPSLKKNSNEQDNRHILDRSDSQRLTREEIEKLKSQGVLGSEMVNILVENSESFARKTEFSQEKYMKKKGKKYHGFVTLHRPTIRLLANVYYSHDPLKILVVPMHWQPPVLATCLAPTSSDQSAISRNFRVDTLAQCMSLGNVQSGGTYMLYETGTNGLLLAAILHALGGSGHVIQLHQGDIQREAVKAMDLNEKDLQCLHQVHFKSLRRIEDDASPMDDEAESADAEVAFAKKRAEENLIKTFLKAGVDGLFLVTRHQPCPILISLLHYLKPSRPFVIFSQYEEVSLPWQELYSICCLRRQPERLMVEEFISGQYCIVPSKKNLRFDPSFSPFPCQLYLHFLRRMAGKRVHSSSSSSDSDNEHSSKQICQQDEGSSDVDIIYEKIGNSSDGSRESESHPQSRKTVASWLKESLAKLKEKGEDRDEIVIMGEVGQGLSPKDANMNAFGQTSGSESLHLPESTSNTPPPMPLMGVDLSAHIQKHSESPSTDVQNSEAAFDKIAKVHGSAVAKEVLELRRMREWEYTNFGKQIISNQSLNEVPQVFTVMSYNVLAQDLLSDHMHLYNSCPESCLPWEFRWKRIVEDIQYHCPDIMCFQEVQGNHYTQEFLPTLKALGYAGMYKQRTHNKVDGCAIFYLESKFKLVNSAGVEFYQPDVYALNKDNVGLIVLLRLKNSGSKLSTPFAVATTHLLYNPYRHDIKLAQLQVLFAELDRLTFRGMDGKRPSFFPIILTGDMNFQPSSPLFKFITEGELQFEGCSAQSLLPSTGGRVLSAELLPQSLGITDQCQYIHIVNQRTPTKHIMHDVPHFKAGKFPMPQYGPPPGLNGGMSVTSAMKPHVPSASSLRDSDPAIVYHSPPIQPRFFSTGALQHALDLTSTYKLYLNRLPRRPPAVTTSHGRWVMVDYIFYSTPFDRRSGRRKEGKLRLVGTYGLLSASECQNLGTMPNFASPSDHYLLLTQFFLHS
ncbi:unnamed protein product [Darwinula stevensoni]|uniref:Methionine--tRNA ligase, mitochondrial n=1 Tax=Darwinula stevensoni TaxID=69355 RepID=A0A7R8X5M3_9CRUS|nr:unnamed protein product [Darwinula stevensoni]CAG0887218.1 unnamed protein product [Darwinula stevensoni]